MNAPRVRRRSNWKATRLSACHTGEKWLHSTRTALTLRTLPRLRVIFSTRWSAPLNPCVLNTSAKVYSKPWTCADVSLFLDSKSVSFISHVEAGGFRDAELGAVHPEPEAGDGGCD